MENPLINKQGPFAEKRKHPRIPYTASIEVVGENINTYGLIKNISVGGIGVELHDYLTEEQAYTFIFTLAHKTKIKTKGQIRWGIHKGDAFVYGVKFLELGFFSKLKLKRFINEQLRTAIN